MSLRNITRQSVLEAIEEFDQVGRKLFPQKNIILVTQNLIG